MDCPKCERDCPNPLVCEDYLADVKRRVFCTKCGKDITYRVKIYVHGYQGGAYCYDCAEKAKPKHKKKTLKLKARQMYNEGKKVSEISKEMDMDKADVYKLLGGGR